ncbi:MAG: hypothetical protein HN435_14000 [Nitrospinaceae bacterium]|nr:hypothetical protein [Nitrospinaceae bacterium]
MPFFEQLADKYAERDVKVFNIYVREPHAGERGFPAIKNHESYDHKLGYAKELASKKKMKNTILIDEMDQKVHEMLGNLPTFVYLIGKDRKVKYKATWSDAEYVDEQLAALVNADPAFEGQSKIEPTIFTYGASLEIH